MSFENMDYDYNEDDDQFGSYEDDYGFEEAELVEPSSTGGSGFDLSALLAPITASPLYTGVVALVVGLVLGLIFAYVIWPTQYINAAPENLHPNFQLDYMRMVVDSYNFRLDNGLAKQRIDALGEVGPEVLQTLINNPGNDMISQQAIQNFIQNYDPNTIVPPTTGLDQGDQSQAQPDAGADQGEQAPDAGEAATPATRSRTLLLMSCAVLGVLGVALGGFWYFRMRNPKPMGQTAAMKAQEFSQQAEQTDYSALGEPEPIAQWMTTYLIGDDLFDDSFSIDSVTGEFLGECGVGIADTIGVGEPKRVSAFEVWLFDKNDIQTVTNVLVSDHAYRDEVIINKLKAKGDPHKTFEGEEIELRTKTLRMVVRVMDMQYGTGHLPEKSFFNRITLELAIWELGD